MSEPDSVAEARRWWQFAREDLAGAADILSERRGVPRHACWLAQQAAEKAIKSALVFLQIEFPKTHDLEMLRTLLPADWLAQAGAHHLAELSEWAVEARYPGDWPEATVTDAERAVVAARAILTEV